MFISNKVIHSRWSISFTPKSILCLHTIVLPETYIFVVLHPKTSFESFHDNNVVHDLRGKLVHPPSGPKQNVINRIYKHLGLKASEYVHGFKRGVYFASFYENTREYLRGEIVESELVDSKKLENDIDGVMDWWKPKAIRRYTNLLEQNRIKSEHLYYRDMIQMRSWDEVQQKYMSQVGR